jgi:hypothetical protein
MTPAPDPTTVEPRPVPLEPPFVAVAILEPPRLPAAPVLAPPGRTEVPYLRPPAQPHPTRLRTPTSPPAPPHRHFAHPVAVGLSRPAGPGPVAPGRPIATAPLTPVVLPAAPVPAVDVDDGLPATTRPVVSPRAARRAARTAATGSGRSDRVNRAVLAVVGVLLVVAGAAGLLLDGGTLHWTSPGRTYRRLAADAAGAVDLSAAVAMAVCLVLFLVGLRWAAAQLRPVHDDGPRLTRITLPDSGRGRTTLAPAVLSRAASGDMARIPGVASARVRLHTLRPVPMALVVVELHLDADLAQVEEEISAGLERLARTVDVAPIEAEVRVRFARSRRPAGPRAR